MELLRMPDNAQALLILILAFLSAVFLIESLYYIWRTIRSGGGRQIRKRLRKLSAAGTQNDDIPNLLRREVLSSNSVLNKLYIAIPRFHFIDRLLERAAPDYSISRYLRICFVFGLTVYLLAVYGFGTNTALGFLIAFLSAMIIPYQILKYLAHRYVQQFNAQLPDAIDFIGRSLRAGNPLSASLKAVSEDMSDPVASEFRTTFDEMKYGIEVEQAMTNLARRTGSDEVRFFVTAILVQRTTGGNLAKILDRLSAVMRARSNTRREITVLSTEMRYSANILVVLPFFVAGAVTFVDPGYLSTLFKSSTGIILVAVQLVLIGIGYYIIQKMVNFRI